MMKKVVNAWFAIMTVLFLSGVAVQAQVYDFESYNVGDVLSAIGWGGMVAEIADDPLAAGNNVLKFTPNNYNAAPVLEFTLPVGKTLADYPTFTFKAYFAQGDVGWKDIIVEAYQTAPTAQAFNNTAVRIGSWNRATGASTAWENITINIAGSSSLTGTIYIAFGINCAGTGGGVTTIWYADDVDLGIEESHVTGLITNWGSIVRHGWPIIPSADSGSAGMGSNTYPQGGWATLRGGFDPIAATESEAVVATGQLEFVGGGATSWSALRFGIFRHDSAGVLINAGTDSARWSGKENFAYGYLLTPRSGVNDQVSGQGGNGTQWAVNGGTWLSTWSGGTMTMGVINQAPARAEMTAGVYNWAFSVRPLGDGTNEVKWYIIKENNSYWFGGTVIDTTGVTTSFNGILFGINGGNGIETTGITGLNIYNARVDLGAPITIPEAPWQAYYVNKWGILGSRHGWKFVPGEFDGDAGMGNSRPPTAWEGLYGEFPEPVFATKEKAVIVSGEIEFLGAGPTTWSPFRYAVFYNDSAKKLINAGTDSAVFAGGKANPVYGYEMTPRSGITDQISGQGGLGNLWSVKGGGYNSTWSGGNRTMGVFNNAPARAEMTAGVYEWAISIQAVNDTTNEVRWYIQKKLAAGATQTSYFIGGTALDPRGASTKFNAVAFAINNNAPLEMTGIRVYAVQVDKGDPIIVPEAPWQAYYVNKWGILGSRHGWKFVPGEFDGDAGMGNSGPPTAWEGLYGEFPEPVFATAEKAVIVSGEIEFLGAGPTTWSPFRYAVFYNDSAKKLINAGTDSAVFAGGKANPVYGYAMMPRSGITDQISGQGGLGNLWSVKGGGYNSSWSGGNRTMGVFNNAPARAEMTAGIYEWAISIQPLGDGTNEVRWYIQKKLAAGQTQTSFWQGGTALDPRGASTKFNAVCFSINNNPPPEMTGIRVYLVQVDKGDPIEIPEKPWQAYYVDAWGFSGGNLGGWDLTPGDFVGDVTIGGTAAPTGWSAVRGGFVEPYVLTTEEDRALIVTGKIELVGGGFEGLASLRYGIFYSDSAGKIIQDPNLDSNWVWNGTDRAHFGYLFVPPSGTNIASWSGLAGTWGAIVNEKWWDIDGSNNFSLGGPLQDPPNAVAGPGTYNFAISVSPQSIGNIVKATLSKTGGGYYYEATAIIPAVATTNKFNCVAFAINNSTTTTMNLMEIQVDRGPHIVTDINDEEVEQLKQVPTVYSLKQNYPNPFNPTTTIEFGLPQNSEINLVAYDISGRVVAELAKGRFEAGYHKFNFDASNLASGVYFVKLRAGDFVSVNKAMLVK